MPVSSLMRSVITTRATSWSVLRTSNGTSVTSQPFTVIDMTSTATFATPGNISNLARQGAMIAILAIGETFVIITGGIDLSVGSIVGFTTVIVTAVASLAVSGAAMVSRARKAARARSR